MTATKLLRVNKPRGSSRGAGEVLHRDILSAVRILVQRSGGEVAEVEHPFQVWWELQVALYSIVHSRLQKESDGRRLAQELFDVMSYDWDQSLRQRGSGDGKTIRLMRHLGMGFYGRLSTYRNRAMGDGDSIRKNLLHAGLSEATAQEMVRALCTMETVLAATERVDVLNGCLVDIERMELQER
ncbi:MAG: ubiquinol-cytochrome C chaperone family protein [Alphaproteobacteria bacterium]